MLSKLTIKKPEQKLPFFETLPEPKSYNDNDEKWNDNIRKLIGHLNKVDHSTNLDAYFGKIEGNIITEKNRNKFLELFSKKRNPLQTRRTIKPLDSLDKVKSKDFFGYASSHNLLVQKFNSINENSASKRSGQFNREASYQMSRKQQATKDRNLEKQKFSGVLANLETKVKNS